MDGQMIPTARLCGNYPETPSHLCKDCPFCPIDMGLYQAMVRTCSADLGKFLRLHADVLVAMQEKI
jgi:hypothetical protein